MGAILRGCNPTVTLQFIPEGKGCWLEEMVESETGRQKLKQDEIHLS